MKRRLLMSAVVALLFTIGTALDAQAQPRGYYHHSRTHYRYHYGYYHPRPYYAPPRTVVVVRPGYGYYGRHYARPYYGRPYYRHYYRPGYSYYYHGGAHRRWGGYRR